MSKSKPNKEEIEAAKEKRSYRVQIILAIIALVGTLGVALLANIDKLRNITNSNSNQVLTSQSNSLQNIANNNSNNIPNTRPDTISLEYLQEHLRPIYFEKGNLKLSENNIKILDEYITLINQCDFIIVLEGHTSPNAPTENMPLSSQMADLVLSYLMDKGVDGKRLSRASFGGERNIQPGDNPYNWRVEFKVFKSWSKLGQELNK